MEKYYDERQPGFISFDIESDGNNPLQNSMRSIGVVLFIADEMKGKHYRIIDNFYDTIQPRDGCKPDDACMRDFWQQHPEQWKHVTDQPSTIRDVMHRLSEWLTKYSVRFNMKWVAGPCNFDWMFLKCNYETFGPVGKYDIGFFCHDLTSLMRSYMIIFNIANMRAFREEISDNYKCTHNALDDATCQGIMYMNLRHLLKCASVWNRTHQIGHHTH